MGREFPDNGFVDADGRLTPAGRDAVMRFRALYPDPLRLLAVMRPGLYRSVVGLIAARVLGAEDFNADVWVTACRSVRRFDPAKGADVAKTFLPQSVRDAAVAVVRRHRTAIRTVPFPADKSKGDAEVIDVSVSPLPPPDHEATVRDEYERVLSVLSPAQRSAMVARFADGLTACEVAARTGVSRQRVCQLCDEGVAKVRRRTAAIVRREPG